MRSTNGVIAGVALAGLLQMVASAVLANPTGPVATTWEEQSGAAISVSPAGDLTVGFSAGGSLAARDTYALIVGGAEPTSAFVGDMSDYTGIRFKIMGSGIQPAEVKLSICSTDIYTEQTRRWVNSSAGVSSSAYEWMINTVPMIQTLWNPLWDYSSYIYTPAQHWVEDIGAVDMLVLSITPSGEGDETYSISQFQLISEDGVTEAATLTPLEAYFDGATSLDDLTADQLTQDSDGDGMSDLDEIAAGMDPLNAESVFAASMEITEDGIIIEWDGVLGASYAVLRSGDLMSDFAIIADGIVADETGPKTYTDTAPLEGSPNFYKVVKY